MPIRDRHAVSKTIGSICSKSAQSRHIYWKGLSLSSIISKGQIKETNEIAVNPRFPP
jgi:hypothetical protein